MIDCFGGGCCNASRCKQTLQRLQARLTYMKNERITTVKDHRRKVAQLVKSGELDLAFAGAEQIVKDENVIQLHELLHELCQIIVTNLPYIRRRRHMQYHRCPNDEVNEAVSTLAFATTSSCLRDLPELQTVRQLFAKRYGKELVDEGLHGISRLVSPEVKERLALAGDTVSFVMKRRKVCEIMGKMKASS